MSINGTIKVEERPRCPLCGLAGVVLYRGLRDRVFGAPGRWHFRRCPNAECGLTWLDPKPVPEDIAKLYQDYYTHADAHLPGSNDSTVSSYQKLRRGVHKGDRAAYLALRYGYKEGRRGMLDIVAGLCTYLHPLSKADFDFAVMHLPRKRGGHLLDVGCGGGQFLTLMRHYGWRASGIDADPTAVETAKSKGLDVSMGNFESQSYENASFDAVTASHVIEHVTDPLGFLVQARNALRTGGHLVAITPNIHSFGHRLLRSNWRPLDPPRHLHLFTPKLLRTIASQAGFRQISVFTSVRDADWIFIAGKTLEESGCYKWGEVSNPLISRWGKRMHAFEWAISRVFRGIGEEIVLVAQK